MDEYIKKKDVLKLLNRNSITKKITLADGISIYDSVKNLPTADVVPKSEVDKLRAELSIACAQYAGAEITKNKLRMELDVCTKFAQGIAKIIEKEALEKEKVKSELASEIFAEIEEDCLDFPMKETDIHLIVDKERYAELKKKYTENIPSPAPEEKYFSPQQVRDMSPQELHYNFEAIRKSMELWQI